MKRPRSNLLLAALLCNAGFSALTGSILMLRPDLLAGHLGVPTLELQGVGVLLALFVIQVLATAWGATRKPPVLLPVLVVTAMDALWVLGTAVLFPIGFERFTAFGAVAFGSVGLVVGLLAFGQWRGLHHLFAEPDPSLGTEQRLEISVDLDVGPDDIWPAIADLGSIGEHAKGLASVRLDGEPGVGATRTCANHAGKRWSERVTGWENGRLTLRFLAEQPDFPFPMRPMIGGWRVSPRGERGSTVVVWWSFTVRPRWLSPLIVPLMARRGRADMTATIASMAALSRSPSIAETVAA